MNNSPISITPNVQLYFKWVNENAEKEPVILFLHEGLGSIAQWKNFPEKLCGETGLKGLVYERQGYGNSSPLSQKRDEKYLHEYALKELPLLIEKLKLANKKIILYGHSDGGSIAYIYAGAYPQNIVGIITEAAHVFVEDVTLNGITPVVKAFQETEMRDKLSQYHGDKTEQIFYAWSDTWHLKRFRNWNIESELRNISCPVLAIQGKDDEYGTELQLDKILTGVSGQAKKLYLPDCGHSPWKEQQEAVVFAVKKFITKIFD